MPTYAYRCTKCEHEFEAVEKITAHPRVKKCPLCGGRSQRVISGGAGFLFKGEGFYVTDYRSEKYRSQAEAEKDPTPEAKEEKGDRPAEAGKKAGKKRGKKR
jgi:putative FmdB family regulatory protein